MKKLIVIVGILLFTSTLFGQLFGGLLGYFYEKPAYEFRDVPFAVKQGTDGRFVYNLTPQKFKVLLDSTWMKDYLNKKTYSFFNNGKFYMLSFEDRKFTEKEFLEYPKVGDTIKRNLFLYRLDDSGWTIGSDKPIMTGFVTHTSYISYFPWRNAGDKPEDINEFKGNAKNGSVVMSADGVVKIVLINHRCENLDKNDSKIIFFNTTVVLQPNPDGTYKVQ